MKIKYIVIITLIFIFGVYLGHKNIPNTIYHKYLKKNADIPETPITDGMDTTDFQSRIRIKNKSDIESLRKKLISIVWSSDTIPLNNDFIIKQKDTLINHPFNKNLIKSSTKIIVTTNEVINSHIYFFVPKYNARNESMIYHNGHGEDPEIEIKCINRLLSEGYFVIRLDMPLRGNNETPNYHFPLMGRLKIENHEILNYFEHPYISYFTPIALAIQYTKNKYQINRYNMMGISGGGWTTQLYAAMDTNILRSYCIAGSVPIEYRFNSPYDWGDAEQHDRRIYSYISYPEIYVLGATGNKRSQVHILNKFDPCCFKAEAGRYYKKAICEKINSLKSGEFIFVADSTEKAHTISKYALDYIMNHLNSEYKAYTEHECSNNIR